MTRSRTYCVALAVLLLATVAGAATIHVPADQPTIQLGINAATSGDTVMIACGTYYEHDISLTPGVVVISETGEPDCVTIDALQLGRVFECRIATDLTRLEGLTVTGGYCTGGAGPGGAGLLCVEASPRVANCIFESNEVNGHGGAVDCRYASSGEFVECLFIGNSSTVKGGAVRCYGSSPSFEDCRFEQNEGSCGGGLYCSSSSPTLVGCVFEENTAAGYRGDGGAVRCSASSPILEGCVFRGNTAWWGGALACEGGYPSLVTCTFFGNGASWGGSAINSYDDSVPSLDRCILAFGGGDGAVRVDEYSNSTPLFWCCDIYGNAGGDWTEPIADQLHTSGNIALDPLFCSQSGRYLDLCEDSPCLSGNHPSGVCDRIGAFDQGCGPCGEVPVENTTWGTIKALYR